jgi:hypothetical protein
MRAMGIGEAWFVQQVQRTFRRDHRSAGRARPGWYYDPKEEARYRFWSGDRWTDSIADQLPPQP